MGRPLMEVVGMISNSEPLSGVQTTSWHDIAEGLTLHHHHCRNLMYHETGKNMRPKTTNLSSTFRCSPSPLTLIRSILCSAITANFSTIFLSLSWAAWDINAATSDEGSSNPWWATENQRKRAESGQKKRRNIFFNATHSTKYWHLHFH